MRALILILSVLLPAIRADPFTGRVVRVSDGDTLTLEADGHTFKVRLLGIDCPEKGQEDGDYATAFTRDAALDRTAAVTQQDVDRYGRVVAYITLPR